MLAVLTLTVPELDDEEEEDAAYDEVDEEALPLLLELAGLSNILSTSMGSSEAESCFAYTTRLYIAVKFTTSLPTNTITTMTQREILTY